MGKSRQGQRNSQKDHTSEWQQTAYISLALQDKKDSCQAMDGQWLSFFEQQQWFMVTAGQKKVCFESWMRFNFLSFQYKHASS